MTKESIDPETYKSILETASKPADPKEFETENPKKEAKADKTNVVLYALIIVLILFGVFIFYREMTAIPAVYKYSNGDSEFEVRRVTDTESEIQFYYGSNPQPYVMTLRYGPLSLEKINLEDKTIKQKLSDDDTVYVTFDADQLINIEDPKQTVKEQVALAGLEIEKFIGSKYFLNIAVKNGLTTPFMNQTVITCDNATEKNTVIWLKKGPETRITTQGNCVIVEGKTETDVVKAADRLALHLVGIMP